MKTISLLFLTIIVFSPFSFSAIFTSSATGNWNLGTTWDQTACGGACTAGIDYPGTGDYAIIQGHTVTVTADGACAVIEMYSDASSTTSKLIINTGITLNVTTAGATGEGYIFAYSSDNVGGGEGSFISNVGNLNVEDIWLEVTTSGAKAGMSNTGTFTIAGDEGDDIYFTNSGAGSTTGAVNVSNSGTITMDGDMIFNTTSTATKPILNLSNGSSAVNLKGDITFTDDGGTITASTSPSNNAYINFNGTAAQTIRTYTGITYRNIKINNTAGVTLGGNLITGSSIQRPNVTIETGTLDNGGYSITSATGKTFQVNNGATFKVSDGNTFPTGFTTYTMQATSTVEYSDNDGSPNQTIANKTYGHLTLSGSGNKDLEGSSAIAGNLTINGAAVFRTNGFSPTISGNWANNVGLAGYTATAGDVVTFGGSAVQSITGTTTFSDVTVSNTGAAVSLASGTITARNLNINASATFASNGNNLYVTGNWTNNATGTFTATAGDSVIFNGSSPQAISGTTTFKDVVINSSSTVSLSDSITVKDLEIAAGTFATNGKKIILTGNWSNSGTYTATDGDTVRFASTNTNQTISGNTTFSRLIIDNTNASGTVTVSSGVTSIDAKGILDVNNGTLNTNASVTLVSSASGTASIGDLTGNLTGISGNIKAQRYANERNKAFYMLASPLTNANFEDWNQETEMQGFIGTEYPPASWKSVVWYDEDSIGVIEKGYRAPSNTTDVITNGRGVMVYMGTDKYGSMPKTLDLTGTAFTGNYYSALSLTGGAAANNGWHMIGNPFAATVSFDNISANWTDLTDANRLLNDGNYAVLGAGDTIASHEAFWVRATTASADITIDESDKLIPGTDPYNKTKTTEDFLTLNIALQINNYSSKAKIRFSDSATVNWDKYDYLKLGNLYGMINVSTLVDSIDMAWNTVPSDTAISIPIHIWKPYPSKKTENYSLSFTGVNEYITNGKCAVLEDRLLGISMPLSNDTSYSFSTSDTIKVPRFFVHTSTQVNIASTDATCTDVNDGLAVVKGSGTHDYIWTNYNGDTLRNVSGIAGPDSLTNLTPGMYYVKVVNSGSCGDITSSIEIKGKTAIQASASVVEPSCGNKNGEAIISAVNGTYPYSYQWDTLANNQTDSVATGLSDGTFSVTISDVNNCKKVASINLIDTSEVTITTSSADVSCKGFDDGSATVAVTAGVAPYTYSWSNGKTTDMISDLTANTYTVTVTDINGCSDTKNVQVSEPSIGPQADFSANNDTIYFSDNDNSATVYLTNNSFDAIIYDWDFGDNTTSSDYSPWHNYTATGSYIVRLIASTSTFCSDTLYKTITVVNATGQQSFDISKTISIVQRNNDVDVHFNLLTPQKVKISLKNILGQEVISPISQTVQSQVVMLTIPNDVNTVCFIYITSEEGNTVKKLFLNK